MTGRYFTTRVCFLCFFFFFNDTATTEIYTLSLHDALPISVRRLHGAQCDVGQPHRHGQEESQRSSSWRPASRSEEHTSELQSLRHLVCRLLLERIRRPPRSTLFPYRRSSDLTALNATLDSLIDMAKKNLNVRLLGDPLPDRKSTRLNSSHLGISYAVFCLKGYGDPRDLHSFPTDALPISRRSMRRWTASSTWPRRISTFVFLATRFLPSRTSKISSLPGTSKSFPRWLL